MTAIFTPFWESKFYFRLYRKPPKKNSVFLSYFFLFFVTMQAFQHLKNSSKIIEPESGHFNQMHNTNRSHRKIYLFRKKSSTERFRGDRSIKTRCCKRLELRGKTMYHLLYHEETLHTAHTMNWVFHESFKTDSLYFLNVVNRPSFGIEAVPIL
jgi:hypothetical protein